MGLPTSRLPLLLLGIWCLPSHSAEPAPGTYNQPMANAEHNNWVAGKPVTDPVELWRVELKRAVPNAYPVYVDGVFYFINDGKLRGYDAGTGKEVFVGPAAAPTHDGFAGSFSADAECVYMLAASRLTAADRKTGKEVWSLTLPGASPPISNGRNTPVLYEDKLLVCTVTKLLALDRKTGKTVWEFATPQEIASMPCAGGGVVVIGSYPTPSEDEKGKLIWYRKGEDARLFGLEAGTGKMLWEQPLGKLGFSQNPGIWGEAVFTFHRNGGVIVRRELKTGEAKWQTSIRVEPRSCGLAIDGRHVVGGGKPGGFTANLDLATGKVIWRFKELNDYNWTPSIIVGDCVYISGTYHFPYHTYCVRLADGKTVWEKSAAIHAGFGGGRLLYRFYEPDPKMKGRAGKGYVVCVGQKGEASDAK